VKRAAETPRPPNESPPAPRYVIHVNVDEEGVTRLLVTMHP
jgi:hypothetical protein